MLIGGMFLDENSPLPLNNSSIELIACVTMKLPGNCRDKHRKLINYTRPKMFLFYATSIKDLIDIFYAR